MAELLKGAEAAAAIDKRALEILAALRVRGIAPVLATVRVGGRGDDIAYESSVVKRCDKVGLAVRRCLLPADSTQDALIDEIEKLNADSSVNGVLIFMPLPKHLDGEAARRALSPEKDVDGITEGSLAGVFTGSGRGFPPCTAQACIEILDHYGINCSGRKAVVIGRSLVVGKPVSMMLLAKNATVTICHSGTADMPSLARGADILICAAGKPKMLGKDFFSENQTVIDVGINFSDGKMCGDADFEAAAPVVRAISPVPGGVGSVTTSVLISHVLEAAEKQSANRSER